MFPLEFGAFSPLFLLQPWVNQLRGRCLFPLSKRAGAAGLPPAKVVAVLRGITGDFGRGGEVQGRRSTVHAKLLEDSLTGLEVQNTEKELRLVRQLGPASGDHLVLGVKVPIIHVNRNCQLGDFKGHKGDEAVSFWVCNRDEKFVAVQGVGIYMQGTQLNSGLMAVKRTTME